MQKPKDKMIQTQGKKKLSQKAVLLIITGGFAVIVIILLFLIGGYRNVQTQSQQRRVHGLKAVFTNRYAYYHKLKLDQETLKKIKPQYAQIRKKLLTNQTTSQALDEITQLVEKENLKLIQFNPGKIIHKKYYNTLPIKVALIGEYRNIKRFIDKLANQNYIIVVDNMSMVMRDLKKGDIHLYLVLNLFYRDKADQNGMS